MNMIEELKKYGSVIENPSMKKYTTYKIGGTAKALISPKDEQSLLALLHYLQKNNIHYKVIGNGSNLIFCDEPYNGVIIKLDQYTDLSIKGNEITVGAGYFLPRLALKLSKSGYTGLEFAAGIPGTIGGCIYMNAGAYGSDMGYITKEVKVITPNGKIKVLSNQEMNFHYRTSWLKENKGYICLEATLSLKRGNPKEIMELIADRRQRRMQSQPLTEPSAGSVFRNPSAIPAWKLIEQIGYKGKQIGGAKVSTLHANFIINTGNATRKDVETLIKEIQEKVYETYKVPLLLEQELVENEK